MCFSFVLLDFGMPQGVPWGSLLYVFRHSLECFILDDFFDRFGAGGVGTGKPLGVLDPAGLHAGLPHPGFGKVAGHRICRRPPQTAMMQYHL